MKKTSTLMILLLMMVAMCYVGGAWAQDPNLADDYTLVKSADFGYSGCPDLAVSSEALSFKTYQMGYGFKDIYPATAPEDIVGWMAFQGVKGSNGWWNRSNYSLYAYGAERSAAVYGEDLTLGWIVAITCKTTASNVITLTNGDGNPDGTFIYQLSEDGKTYYCTITSEENAYVGFCGIKGNQGITNISVYQPNTPVVAANYQVTYQDSDGNELKEPVTEDGLSGFSVFVADSHKENILSNDACYIYVSDDAADKKIAADGTTVITITFRKAETWSYTVNAVDEEGNVLEELANDSYFEGETVYAYYSRYIIKDGVLYEKPANNNEYRQKFNLTSNNMTVDVVYSKSSQTNLINPVYFSEAENMDGITRFEDKYTQIRMSKGAAGYATALTTITTLPAGVYTLTSATRSGTTKFYAASDSILGITSKGSVYTGTSEEFTLYEPTEIKVAAGSKNAYFDYLLICRMGDAPLPELVIDDNETECDDFAPEYDKYSKITYNRTFNTDYTYNLITLPFAPDAESLDTYKFYTLSSVDVDVDAVTFTEVDAPVANTPYLYCLNEGVESATSITGGETTVSTDVNNTTVGTWTLVGSLKNETIDCANDATTYNYYVFNPKQNTLHWVTGNLTVYPYTAYLRNNLTNSLNNLSQMRVFIGTPTGIKEISRDQIEGFGEKAGMFDLQGRALSNPAKGQIYIENGEKKIKK